MKKLGTLSAAALCAALGCSDTTTGGTGGASLTVDAFPAAYFRALCTSLFQCPAQGDNGSVVALFENPTVCTQRAPLLAGTSLADLVGFVRDGSIRFDGAAARTCLDQVSAACVADDAEVQRVCRRAFTGTLTVGAGCWRSDQCAAGTFCDHGTDSTRRCPGACRAQVGVAAACATDRECLGWSEGTAICQASRCVAVRAGAPAAEGQRCGDITNADMTVARTACATGLGCRGGTCRRVLAAGAPCVAAMDVCAAGTVCAQRPGTTGTTCSPGDALVRSTPGGTCNPTLGRPVFCNPTARLTCNAAMSCESLGDGTMGSRCLPGGDLLATTCNVGLRCDATSSTCVAALANGATCMRDNDCLSGDCEGGRCLEHACQ